MKKFAMILAASAMALGTYSCQQGGSTPKDSVD
ncbi:MAG: FKBP-type peptidyl-prolyl cis-trans isomerase, partial [Porphyromonadaceae bacterium]|nr:FKBP-type peptidyl-prolyl cis-trans isomerase [Porphyromonadaceae bacterium]